MLLLEFQPIYSVIQVIFIQLYQLLGNSVPRLLCNILLVDGQGQQVVASLHGMEHGPQSGHNNMVFQQWPS